MQINLDPEKVHMSKDEILFKLEKILNINYFNSRIKDGIVVEERHGYETQTNVDPEVFSAFCTIYDYLMKCGKYVEKDNKNIERMRKLW